MTAAWLRDEALLILEGKGAILKVARRIPEIFGDDAAVIGAVAVILHGYVRTTTNVDVHQSHGKKRETVCNGVPIHIFGPSDVPIAPRKLNIIDGIRTISLPDLVNMKLLSGMSKITRAIDIADVIGLIRHRKLTSEFARKLHKSVQSEFRKLAKAVQEESR